MQSEYRPNIFLPLVVASLCLATVVGAVIYYGNQRLEASNFDFSGLEVALPEREFIASLPQSFSAEEYQIAKESGRTVLLYFYSSWCPECTFGLTRLEEAMRGYSQEELAAFLVSFRDLDTSEEELALADDLAVTVPGTKVFLRGSQELGRSEEMWSFERYRSELAQVLGKRD